MTAVDGIKQIADGVAVICQRFGDGERPCLPRRLIRRREMVIVIDVLPAGEVVQDGTRLRLRDADERCTVVARKFLVEEQRAIDFARAVHDGCGNIMLQVARKRFIALARDDGEEVHLLYGALQPRLVHALAVLIDAEAHAAANFLPFARLAAALLQRADLEDVRIVPALFQRGVRENEPHRRATRIEVEQ